MKVSISCRLPKEEYEFSWRWKALRIRARAFTTERGAKGIVSRKKIVSAAAVQK
jgi:hypothetical protein